MFFPIRHRFILNLPSICRQLKVKGAQSHLKSTRVRFLFVY